MDHRDLDALTEKFRPIIGLAPWDVALGVGSFVTLEFGEKISESGLRPGTVHVHGAYHVWIMNSAWRVEADGAVLAGSNDEETAALEKALGRLRGRRVSDVSIPSSHVMSLRFDGGLALHTFGAHSSGDFDQWLLYVPGRVFAMQANGAWTEESRR